MAIAGGNITLDSTEGMDKISQTEKVTSPYHSDGSSILLATNIVTSSNLTSTNESYFFGIANSSTAATEEWNIAFGDTEGHGALVEADTKSETEAIYKQYAGLLLAPTEVTGGFFISSPASSGAISSGKDKEIFVLSARRSNMKDRLNKGTWTVVLSGSAANGSAGSGPLSLTDDSANDSPTATPVGDRYNIVSGAAGTIVSESTARNFGFFYPDMGILVFSAAELSASIPSHTAALNKDKPVQFGPATDATAVSQSGFTTSVSQSANQNTALRFLNCLKPNGAKLDFRDEEDQVSAQYFCRVRSGQMNFSNNPTFVSGSLNELRQKTMRSNPTTFITSVQLYNNAGEMVAVGNLSTPLKKNFQSEATIKVKLTY